MNVQAPELRRAASEKVRALMIISDLRAQLQERTAADDLLVAFAEEAQRRRGRGRKAKLSVALHKIMELRQVRALLAASLVQSVGNAMAA